MELDFDKYVTKTETKTVPQNNDALPSTNAVNDIGFTNLTEVSFFTKFFDIELSDLLVGKTKDMVKDIYAYAQSKSKDVPGFVRELKSKIGTQPGVNPLKSVYTWISLHKEREEAMNKARVIKTEIQSMKR